MSSEATNSKGDSPKAHNNEDFFKNATPIMEQWTLNDRVHWPTLEKLLKDTWPNIDAEKFDIQLRNDTCYYKSPRPLKEEEIATIRIPLK